ncbi:TonB family protein [Stappia sp. F7233]|uniref:TonB family protein n=1 Tax=Stappia albiluteola TaxID=2758565 RepID=A0A839AB85_9HYPH|nr:energy transducer TonB [Stappia albiluteola]MBA5776167.1 TonB family protein [Stappia albiluteola]
MSEGRLVALCLALSAVAHLVAFSGVAVPPAVAERSAVQGGEVAIAGSLADLVEGGTEEVREEKAAAPVSEPPRSAAAPVEASSSGPVPPRQELPTVKAPAELQQPASGQAALPEPVRLVEARPTAKPKLPKSPRKEKPGTEKPRDARRKGGDIASRKGAETKTAEVATATEAGRAEATGSDGGQAAFSNYQGQVLRKLQRAKRKLPSPRSRRDGGTVHLRFTILRDGSVMTAKVARSSGHAALDEAALALIRRAAPMPGVPGEITRVPLTFTVPVHFESN